jgi:hypothetical protein
MLSRFLAAATLVLGLLAFTDPIALAQGPECQTLDLVTGQCRISITPPAPERGVEPVSGGGSTGEERACTQAGKQVPCSDPLFGGWWSNTLQCYLTPMRPPPAADSPLWQGNFPQGAVYNCVDPSSGPFSSGAAIWLPEPPDSGVTPEQAARAVVSRMTLRAADIGIVPEDRPGSIGAVGAPVYMWTTPGPTTFGPQVLTGSAGGVTITASARVERIVWSMGDGSTVTCRTPGTPYEDRYGFRDSPDCGHRYTKTSAGRPGNAYPIIATSYWVVDWTGPGGSSGQITLDLTSTTSIVVGELQAVVTR